MLSPDDGNPVPLVSNDRVRRGLTFLAVGGLAFLVDAAVYNLLVFAPDGTGPLFHAPLPAKIVAVVVASIATYVGNRYWTFGDRNSRLSVQQVLVFSGLNIAAIGLQLVPLAISRYLLGLDSPLADNISGTFIGQALATIFRFLTYDRFVFVDRPDDSKLSGAQP